MQRYLPLLCTLAILCTVAFAVRPGNAADPEDRSQQVIVIVYPVADLPVWRQGGKYDEKFGFNPTVLTALIKSTIGSESWSDDSDSIKLHGGTASLVIRTTRANHKGISELVESLRRADEREDVEKVKEDESTSQAVEYHRLRCYVLHAIFKSERLAESDIEAAAEIIDETHQRLQQSPLESSFKMRLEQSLSRHLKSLECRHSLNKSQNTHKSDKQAGDVSATEKISQKANAIVLPPNPVVKQIEQLPHRQSVPIPIDVEFLADRLSPLTAPHQWPTWREWDIPDDRDFSFGGYRFTR